MQAPDPTFLALQSALAGEYSLERELGRGGMGIVYLAREVLLDRLVAIKALPAEHAAREDVRERFLRESKTAASLSHPNIVPIHRVGEANGIPYFVMTFVRGETLGERLRARGPVSPPFLTRVMHDVALALGYAHGRGVIHRDVKPDNILIEEGSDRALVTDFGIARVASDAGDDDSVMGTAHFMSPEQAMGEALDGRSDVYSLGVVAFLAASGRLPFADGSLLEYAAARSRESAPPVASVASGLSGATARVIDRCLERESANRFKTAEEIAAALDASTAPAKATLPIPLRLWVSSPTPMLPVYQISSVIFSMLTAHEINERLLRTGNGAALWIFLSCAAAPIVPITIFQLRKTGRTLAAGYTIADLRLALRTWIAERRDELSFESGTREPMWARIIRWVPLSAALAAVWVAASAAALGGWVLNAGWFRPTVGTLALICAGSFLLMTGLGVSVEPPGMHRKSVGRLQTMLWNSRFGGWLAKMLTPKKRGVPDSAFRPTELALGIAVDELFAALPASYQKHVGDLPAVGGRLMTEAAWLRSEVNRLEDLRAHARADETELIDPMLAGAKSQLGRTVSALEQMRLELLRLHGGANDVRQLTTSLDAARQMMDDLARLREAEIEIEPRRRRFAIDSRTPSPA